MEESQRSFRQEPASAKPCCGPCALDIHRARQRNFASRGSRRRPLHSPLWPDQSGCLGAKKRQGASSQGGERKTWCSPNRNGSSSSRHRSVAAKTRSTPGRAGSPLHAIAFYTRRGGAHGVTRPTKETPLRTPETTAYQSG